MVFDPLSVIGYVGTAAGLVGFLVSTVSRLEQFRLDFRDAVSKLDWYEDRLTSIDGKLSAWGRLWCGGYSDDDYEYFWGQPGFGSVQRKMALIEYHISEIGALLYDRAFNREVGDEWRQASQSAAWRWERLRLELESVRSNHDSYAPRVDLISRVFFAAFRGATLKELTTELEKMVNNLESDTQRLLYDMQFRPTTSYMVDDDVLRRVLDRREWVDEHRTILAKLFALSRRVGSWSLVLRSPDEQGELSSIDGGNGIKIEFDALSTLIDGQTTKELGIVDFYPSRFPSSSSALRQWYSDEARCTNPRLPTREDYLIARFTILSRRDTACRQRLARAAVGLVNWTMLLWDTPWTDGICSCQTRFVTFPRGGIDVTVATFMSAKTCEKTRQDHFPHKSLLMGVSLAELALLQSITVILNVKGTTEFSISGSPVTEKELLKRIKMKNGPGYRHAVWYCFEYNRKLPGGGFRPYDIMLFKENVIQRYVNNP